MGKIINGVPNWAVYAGGAFAVYWFFFREGATFNEPVLSVQRLMGIYTDGYIY